jgi:hypothetical protein
MKTTTRAAVGLILALRAITTQAQTAVDLGTNFARFRLTSIGGVGPTGPFRDGEVEDYQVVIQQRHPATNTVITNIVVTNLVTSTLTGQVVTMQWNAEVGIVYQMRATTNLTGAPTNLFWTDVGDVVIGPANTQKETNTMRLERYYRVVAPYTLP